MVSSHNVNILITDTTFTSCAKTSLLLSFPQSIMKNSSIVIMNCNFTNNEATNGANGSVIVIDSAVSVNISNCLFFNNIGVGAIMIRDSTNLYVNYCHFINNTAKNDGGALTAVSIHTLHIFKSNFNGNTASNSGGAIFVKALCDTCQKISHLRIVSSNFTSNKAIIDGGALAVKVRKIRRYISWNRRRFFISYYLAVQYEITILSSFFYQNSRQNGGALFLFRIESIIMRNSRFWNNDANITKRFGGAMFLSQVTPSSSLIIDGNSFVNNMAKSGGSLYFRQQNKNFLNNIELINCLFSNNKAISYGGALYISHYAIRLNSTTLSFNKASQGGAVYLTNAKLNIIGAIFQVNRACTGGAIYSSESQILLYEIKLDGNQAINGSENIAKLISAPSIPHIFNPNCNDMYTGKGGGLYIHDQDNSCKSNLCPLIWNNSSNIHYINNSAKSGPLLYGGMINTCSKVRARPKLAVLTKTEWNTSSMDYAITSDAMYFCFAFDKNCESRIINKTVYLGQTFSVCVACLDQVMQLKKCNVRGEFKQSTQVSLDAGEQSRDIDGYTNLTFHAYSQTKNNAILMMKSDIFCTTESMNSLEVHLLIKTCPLGFEKKNKRCQCDSRLTNFFFEAIKCDIDNISISISEGGWFGYDEEFLRVHRNCPLNYCTQEGNTTSESYPHSPCANNRGGILCGQCIANYSIVIGSWKCEDCTGPYNSYNFIWLTIVLALAGVVLVVFLLLIKMTVSSGTTNGLILYANIMSLSGLLDLRNCSMHSVLRVFLSWINLDLGIEVCYYSGMDVYEKTWLQFVFPFYIWFLVGVIILFCHYSSRVMKLMGMRNIEVLATLFLLSYAKLLKTIVASLSYTDLEVANASDVSENFTEHRVWLYNAHIDYLSPQHLPLFIVAVLLLLILFTPFTVLLLLGQYLPFIPRKRGLHWIHSPILSTILDAYFAPYKKNTRFWTGLGLLLRCILFTLFGTSYSISNNLFWIVILIGFLLLLRLCFGGYVYQKKAVDWIEIIFATNLVAVALILRHNSEFCGALTASVSLSLILFIGLLFFHVYLEVKQYATRQNWLKKRFSLNSIFHSSSTKSNDADLCDDNINEWQLVTYSELRETLIEN